MDPGRGRHPELPDSAPPRQVIGWPPRPDPSFAPEEPPFTRARPAFVGSPRPAVEMPFTEGCATMTMTADGIR
ncbi:hypothetical protein BIV24_20095 [Streptomyces colonosanans]|uniref:Uncharacterized protein n=1 Tax=Streptomyces colonosanans TaxID=1428652 RepID=A0A1S2P7F0_9ACTN|nr:hypothetical protein BIV24_20095 [Streptomyces colonosanans]